MNLKYIVVLILAYTMASGNQRVSADACERNYISKTFVKKNNRLNFDKKQVNNTRDENSGFKRKYKPRGTEVAIVHIPNLEIIQYFKFTRHTALIGEKSRTLRPYFYCPERGPPVI